MATRKAEAEKTVKALTHVVQVNKNTFECEGCGFSASKINDIIEHIYKCQYIYERLI